MAGYRLEDFQKAARAAADTQVAAAAKEKKAEDEKVLAEAKQAVDSRTAEKKAPYETKLEEAPGEYRVLFDRNALNEELGRQAVELKVANMGLENSGLAASSQVALALQRSRADEDTGKSMQTYVDKLESAIKELNAAGEAQKKELEQKSAAAFDKWYDSTLKKAYTEADKTAKTLYKEKQDELADQVEVPDEDEEEEVYVVGGAPELEAVSAMVPEGTIKALIPILGQVAQWDASKGGIFNKTFWTGPKGDGENVYEDVVQEQLEKASGYAQLSDENKSRAAAIAIGKSVATTWQEAGALGANMQRIDAAINRARELRGWDDATTEKMRAIAKTAYNAL